MKRALITGIGGQDGVHLTQFLSRKGYEIHGIHRRPFSFKSAFDEQFEVFRCLDRSVFLHYGDLTDANNILRVIQDVKPDEIYNLAAESRVAVSFDSPESTANVNALGTLRLLEAVRVLHLTDLVRFYQASTSELYGLASESPQSETTPFHPRSPYAVAKLYAYWITVNYREAYGMYACNGILFNHESALRGDTFVTRKITQGLARIKVGLEDRLLLGNMGVKRDWGHARDYVEMMWIMLQQESPEDYVIATGQQYTVREFVCAAAEELGMRLNWSGQGLDERAYDTKGRCVVAVDPRYFRPAEVETVVGDASKARMKLGWSPKTTFHEIVHEMVALDLLSAEREIAAKKTMVQVQG